MVAVPLPGTPDIFAYGQMTAAVGKCPVCGPAKAAWIDRHFLIFPVPWLSIPSIDEH
jgi:hypothetical protein